MSTETLVGDPRDLYPKSPFPSQKSDPPGYESQLTHQADHGKKTYRGSNRLPVKVALITGADSGIGRATALAFAREGADVLISFLSEQEAALETRRLVEESGRKAIWVPEDLVDDAHCRELARHCPGEFGRLDILVNNAAYQSPHEKIE